MTKSRRQQPSKPASRPRPSPPRRPARPPQGERSARPVAATGRPKAARRHRGTAEEMFHGLRACEAVFARRPEAIVRVYLAEHNRRQLQPLLDWCAKHRKGFQIVAAENLQKLTGSIHHEGVAILAKSLHIWSLDELLQAIETRQLTGPLLYLDGVQNPHNLGSILRTAAHFGVAAVLGRAGELPAVSPAAVRVAEGAAEFVPVCELAAPPSDLVRLKRAGYRVVASSSHRGQPLDRKAFGDRCLIVLGGEGEGVSRLIESTADTCVRITGTGAVESLNVAVACGIILAAATTRT